MKYKMESTDTSYKFSFFFVKTSGYAFFTIKKFSNGMIEFCQTWMDYFIFVFSTVFGFYAAFGGTIQIFDFKLKSAILNIGMMVFWQASLICMIMTKVNTFVCARSCVKILNDFRWMDKVVCM